MTPPRVVLRGGNVVTGETITRADLCVRAGRIEAVGEIAPEPGDDVVDCSGRYLLPGFVDAHAHVDGAIFDSSVQLALLRQGITTAIVGQDGVSYAPGDGRYATEYFAAINGPHPTYSGGGVGELLASYDGAVPVNLGYLVPASTVRNEVLGRAERPATPAETERMADLVATGMAEGALGLSTGLDYVPGIFAPTHEIAALCQPVARAGGVYVSHMRGGYEHNSREGTDEVVEIAKRADVPVHVSHFHAEPTIVLGLLQQMRTEGVDVTFDAYPYTRGCTLVAMAILPPELVNRPVPEAERTLRDPAARAELRRDWFPLVNERPSLGPDWPAMILLGHVPHPDYAWAAGATLEDAAEQAGADVIDFTLDLLAACHLEVNATMAVRYRRDTRDLAEIFADPGHQGGSDGIFIGSHLHPRAKGSFARYLKEFVIDNDHWTWPEAARRLSENPARRFRLGERGRLEPGWIADIAVVAPDVADRATYEQPERLAGGVDDVFVAGVAVLRAGGLTGRTPGAGLRRSGGGNR
ncbi:MAG TPA: amidohydrolase family protein [Beutenbergiaceae bacterium]|nr:amidohydrolase family protein [Beutenbergiaceae bacterium]